MCNNSTKQEILTLLALASESGLLSENQLISKVRQLAKSVGWPDYLDHLPMPLHERLKILSSEPLSCISRVKTRYWKANSKTEAQLSYLIESYAPERLRERLFDLSPAAA